MEEVKKNKKKNKVASLLLALALILTCGVAGTIAQYQKSLGGTSTATVAKFKVSAGNMTEDKKAELNLFDKDNIKEISDGSTKESHVTEGKIAPGTVGSIPLTLTNSSDVDVSYTLSAQLLDGTGVISSYTDSDGITKNNVPISLEFTLAKSNTSVPTSGWVSIDDLKNDTNAKGTLTKASNGDVTQPLYLYWRWAMTDGTTTTDKAYKDRNLLDTAIGNAMAKVGTATFTEPKVEVSVDFTQVH